MARTYRFHNQLNSNEGRAHTKHHRFDGHKLAAGVNHNYDMRHGSGAVNIPRSGKRHK